LPCSVSDRNSGKSTKGFGVGMDANVSVSNAALTPVRLVEQKFGEKLTKVFRVREWATFRK